MSDVSSTIWYGAAPPELAGKQTGKLKPFLAWTGVLSAFFIVRLFLPFAPTDSALVHSRIVDALADQGGIWGRQALISSFEFPTFITICMLFAKQVARLLPLDPGQLLVLFAQTWTLSYILRIPQNLTGRAVTLVFLIILGICPEFQHCFFTDDPNWISTVPIASALFHLIRWQRYNSLRDAVVLGCASGLLVFCGPVGLVAALAFLLVSTLNIRRLPRLYDTQNMKGVPLLIWVPFVYCLALLFLGNWLIMNNALYPLRSFAAALTPEALAALSTVIPRNIFNLPWLVMGGLILALISVVGKRKVAAEGVGAGLIALLALEAWFGGTPVFMPGLREHQMILAITAILFPGLFLSEQYETSWKRYLALGLTGLALFAGIAIPRGGLPAGTRLLGEPPAPEEVTELADVYWKRGRIAVFGTRAPAFYFDVGEKRFIKRVDFFPGELLAKAQTEQLYLLIPPDDGRFYAPESTLATLHAEGANWLFMEKAWPSGWQLCRIITYEPPPPHRVKPQEEGL